ncbi:MAG: FAD-dependent oxidoreductase, partial [Lachnospiraceae bacterium]|nr:FAD-dependent oxidoreductase [Lachnospiraceae bacterium]
PQAYMGLTGVDVQTGKEAIALHADSREVVAKDVATGAETSYTYDKLVIATGASPAVLPVEGIDLPGVFTLRTPDDAEGIRAYAEANQVKRAVVIGAGFIGLEAAENLLARGIRVTVIDFADQILPNILDPEMAAYAKKHVLKEGIRVITGAKAEPISGTEKVTGIKTSAGQLPCELLIMAAGVRPNTGFLQESGIEMFKGTIVVDRTMKTNLENVYAVGDCCMVTNRITGKPQWSPMGSTANLSGRTLAQVLTGAHKEYPGVLGTGVVKLPGLNIGRTGLTEAQAKAAGYDVETVLVPTDDKAHYYPDSSYFITKLVADRTSRKLLGIQVFGPGAVDKMVDIAVMGISMGAVLEDFENADFAYAPPFSTAIHPFVQAVYVLMNKLDGTIVSMTPAEYAAGKAKGYKVVDVAPKPSIPGASYVNLASVNGPIEGLDQDEKLLLVCAKGKRGYFLQNRLRYYGYKNTVVLEGATFFNDVKVENSGAMVSKEEETRVKALGFLKDKRTPDKFNGRVITRNGKITADEARTIAEAAQMFGSGEVTMTSRLTMEIQGVPFDQIEPLREYLMQAGLETGGTGSKVRPVVSCKGTTCQYGLIDTFALSEEIHERFYHGYSNVKLPHKFKIAVGGCPNNCVKPDLNDLGIIGQRIPQIDLEKCRGCKKCQIENNCPIHVAKVVDGKITIDESSCNHCGRCVGKCPFHAIESYTNGYRIYIGGRWGKKVAQGRYLDQVFTDKGEVLDIVEKAILLFREQGITGERFADTVARLRFENVQEQLLSDGLLARKEENIKAQKHLKGWATC